MGNLLSERTHLPDEGCNVLGHYSELLAAVHSEATGTKQSMLVVEGRTVELPANVVRMLEQILYDMSQGKAVSIIPHDQVVSTQEASELLGVSRPTLVRLCEEGKIPFSKPNRHRRLRLVDVLNYRESHKHTQNAALAEIAAQTELYEDYDQDPNHVKEVLKAARAEAPST